MFVNSISHSPLSASLCLCIQRFCILKYRTQEQKAPRPAWRAQESTVRQRFWKDCPLIYLGYGKGVMRCQNHEHLGSESISTGYHWRVEQVTLSLVISDSEITCGIRVTCVVSLLTEYTIFLQYLRLLWNYDIYVRERKDIES